MADNDAPQGGYKLIILNSRSTPMTLTLEPLGWYWEMEPGATFEIVFEEQRDFDWTAEPIEFTEQGVIFWGAYPTSVVWVLPDERREMMA